MSRGPAGDRSIEGCGILSALFRRTSSRRHNQNAKEMRLKLVIIASLIAAIVGAGSAIAVIVFAFSSASSISTPGVLAISTYLLPLLTTLLAAIFVYRHTARRRKLQAALTVLITLLLTLALFISASIISSRNQPVQPSPDTPRNTS